jgi:hypothetical protein
MTDPGPYLDDDGNIWYPTDAWTWNKAQRDAAGMARWMVGDWCHIVYRGTGMYYLHDHEDWEGCEEERCLRRAYHFEVEE